MYNSKNRQQGPESYLTDALHTASSKLFQSMFSFPRFTTPDSSSFAKFSSCDRVCKLPFAAEKKFHKTIYCAAVRPKTISENYIHCEISDDVSYKMMRYLN
jgi:hypothetical protein